MKYGIKKFVAGLLILLIAFMLPFIALVIFDLLSPAQYGGTFLYGLSEQMDNLRKADGNKENNKIIIIGGSSVIFGVDAGLLEQCVPGYNVVNFGLYASLGTKVMLDLSRDYINDGDIIIIAPELYAETLSDYFNAKTIWQAIESDRSMLFDLPMSDFGLMAGGYPGYLSDKIEHIIKAPSPPAGVYSADSFGDEAQLLCAREYNTMVRGYDPTFEINLNSEIYSPAMVDYINDYAAYAKGRGADVYYSFSPVNKSALAADTTEESILGFYDGVCRQFDFEVISDINDCIMDKDYFFDTNFHLNEAGATVHTVLLAYDIRRILGIADSISVSLPDAPARPQTPDTPDITDTDNSEYYTYEKIGNGYSITGVTTDGMKRSELTTPLSYEGLPIVEIGIDAFDGCAAETITITKNIAQLNDSLFSGCDNLKKIYIMADSAENIMAGAGLFDGAPDDAVIITSDTAFGSFISNYFWVVFADRIITEE